MNDDVIDVGSFLDEEKKIITDNFFGQSDRLDKLRKILEKLKEYNYEIIIASKTEKNIIVLLLKFSNLFSLFNYIYGSDYIKNKNLGINGLISEKINTNQYKYLYYFDYDHKQNNHLLEKYKLDGGSDTDAHFYSTILNNVNYHFFKTLSKDCKGLSISDLEYLSEYIIENSKFIEESTIPITKNKCKKHISADPSSISHNKYLKYKQKYLDLKNYYN
jgi:hypothetical protein